MAYFISGKMFLFQKAKFASFGYLQCRTATLVSFWVNSKSMRKIPLG